MYCGLLCARAESTWWVESIGVANENAAFAVLMGLAKRFKA
jgi:hypothetical protein